MAEDGLGKGWEIKDWSDLTKEYEQGRGNKDWFEKRMWTDQLWDEGDRLPPWSAFQIGVDVLEEGVDDNLYIMVKCL